MRLPTGTYSNIKPFFLFTSVVCGLALLFFIAQLWVYIQKTEELATARGELALAESVITDLENEQGKLLEINSTIAEIEKLFQMEIRDGAHLVLLGQLSKAMGVEITGVTADKTQKNSLQENAPIVEIPLVLSVKGDYLDLLAFCQELEYNALQNFTVIRRIKIASGVKTTDKRPVFASLEHATSSETVIAEVGISIFTTQNPRNTYRFDWKRGSNPSIFYRPAALPGLPFQSATGSQP